MSNHCFQTKYNNCDFSLFSYRLLVTLSKHQIYVFLWHKEKINCAGVLLGHCFLLLALFAGDLKAKYEVFAARPYTMTIYETILHSVQFVYKQSKVKNTSGMFSTRIGWGKRCRSL